MIKESVQLCAKLHEIALGIIFLILYSIGYIETARMHVL